MLKIFQKILGVKYLINRATGEVHRIKNINAACGVDRMAKKNKWYVTERQYQKLIQSGEVELNGCVHCFKETDKD